MPTLIAAAETRARIPLSAGAQARDWVYVEDVARALLELAALDAAPILAARSPFDAPCLNLASGRLTSVREFVLRFAREFELDSTRLGFGDLPELAEEMHHPPVPVGRLGAALGWTPPNEPALGLARLRARVTQGLA